MTSFTNATTNYPEGANTPIKRVKRNGPPTPNPPTSRQAANFTLGDEWLDVTGGDWWKLASNPTGGVLWVRIGGTGGSDIAQITPDSGVPVIGIANNIYATGFPVGTTNLKGIKTFNGGGAGDILDLQNLRDLSRYIVGTNANESQFTSIQTAINTAVADGFNTANPTVVYILPGTYVENLTLQPGIALAGVGVNAESATVLVQGAAVLNPAAGTNSFSATGITFATNGAASPAFSIQGANSISVFLNNCAFLGNSGTAYETLNTSATPKHSSCTYNAATGQKCFNLLGADDLFINCISSFTDTKSVINQKCSFFDCAFTDSFNCIGTANPLFFNCLIISTKFPATNFEAIAIAVGATVGLIDCFLDTNSPTGFSVTGTGTLGYNLITSGQPFDPALTTFGFETKTGNLSFDGGTTNIASDGQLIIGDTGSFPKINTLTAGPGVSITNGAGSITIGLTGGGTAVDSFTTNIAGPVSPNGSGSVLVNASVTTFTDGTVANTLKTEVQASNHLLIVGRGTNVAASTITAGTQGTILAQDPTGADPVFTRTVNGDGNMTFQAFTSATGHFLVSENDFTAAGSNAGLVASCAGGSGIPAVGCTITASRFFADTIDQTDSDAYKLLTAANSTMTAGSTIRRFTTTGVQTLPLQPAFLAYNAANVTNATGDGTVVTVSLDTESFDQGGNFAASTYTNPQTSKVNLTYTAAVFNLGVLHTSMIVQIVADGTTYEVERFNPGVILEGASSQVTVSGSIVVSMAAATTAVLTITVSGSTKTVGITGTLSGGVKFGGFVPC